ncbi:5-methylcytosine rRNA methyltransferase NSUN4 [Nasonia vitripennis]|uniref:NOL1/NOP2/Sun domain family member 4 n=1 Tax=Nasonia vitripennis TaxID=7425 RepID=A0A7M7G9P6_NASVI|nr:5-methylcytosine rRNA methyltransferase NSUN4 [Nasonia vitripennis]XP_031778529.1 5-methylcytosine rRNA methyltransferase NSUN4 [Nasonia vitripennis]
MTRLFKNIKLFNALKIPVRYKNPSDHWSMLKRKKPSTKKALDHFDDFYQSVYGSDWANIRSALLSENNKYIAVLNNFSDTERICEELQALGAMNLKDIYEASKKNLELHQALRENKEVDVEKLDKNMGDILSDEKMKHSFYPESYQVPRELDNVEREDVSSFKPVQMQSIEKDQYIANDRNRIISSSAGVSASQLFEYVPATKIKGKDDFVLESEHYGYYTQGADFVVKKEEEDCLNFPEKLLLYTFEEGSSMKFPKAKNGSTKVLDYFVLDGASVLPVLSLDLQPGDTVLDMCAAPGGKIMTALQTLNARLIIANDIQESRINRINRFMQELLPSIGDWDKRFFITQSDARYIEDKNIYNKILVDVPCTTDRHVLHEDDNNIFKSTRVKERLRLPEIQCDILKNALKIAILGGTVVYSTCSLSPIQNDGVVQMALKKAFEESNVLYVVKDQTRALKPLQFLYNFGDNGLKYGHIVVPSKSRNWGPMYFCKMVRVQ